MWFSLRTLRCAQGRVLLGSGHGEGGDEPEQRHEVGEAHEVVVEHAGDERRDQGGGGPEQQAVV
jgi:hypothetical protein